MPRGPILSVTGQGQGQGQRSTPHLVSAQQWGQATPLNRSLRPKPYNNSTRVLLKNKQSVSLFGGERPELEYGHGHGPRPPTRQGRPPNATTTTSSNNLKGPQPQGVKLKSQKISGNLSLSSANPKQRQSSLANHPSRAPKLPFVPKNVVSSKSLKLGFTEAETPVPGTVTVTQLYRTDLDPRQSQETFRSNNQKQDHQSAIPPIPQESELSSLEARMGQGDGHSQRQLSLIEQKKRQWAREREELSGLWNPWPNTHQSHYPHHPEEGSFLPNEFSAYSPSDHYLPPINDNTQYHRTQRSNSSYALAGMDPRDRDDIILERKGSLPMPSEDQGRAYRLQPHEQKSTYHREGNAEWMIIHTGDQGHDHEGEGKQTMVVSPRVVIHKISMDTSEDHAALARRGVLQETASSYNRVVHSGDGDGLPMSRGYFGGSSGYLDSSSEKPPPVAMRSSLTIGIPSTQITRFGGSFEDIARKEREQWLHELDKQREEQRMRKLMEKDEKRARWGDRGVGVGHFWEPTDSRDRLPSQERESRGRLATTGGGSTPPGWLQRSLQLHGSAGSQSQPNLYDGPLPSQFAVADNNNNNNLHSHDTQFNRSSIDLTAAGRIAEEELHDNGVFYGDDQKSVRGQTAMVNPVEQAEKDRRLRANAEYLEEVKKQIEDKKRMKEQERQKLLQEEREHEIRMVKQRELELQRIEMEKRPKKNSDAKSPETHDAPSHGHGLRRANDVPIHESPLIPSSHPLVPELDAYEVAIARRQAMTLAQSDSVEKSDSVSISASERENYNVNSHAPVQYEDEIQMIPDDECQMIDECLNTDTDHIYQRTLTPTKNRRSRSIDTARSREFGTQTEMSDLTTDDDKDHAGKKTAQNNSTRSRSIPNLAHVPKKLEEKPRWGSNPVRKVYLKQSEKDLVHQHRVKKRQQIHGRMHSESDDVEHHANDHDDPAAATPFHRTQNRARARERLNKISDSHLYSHSQSHVTAHIRTENEHHYNHQVFPSHEDSRKQVVRERKNNSPIRQRRNCTTNQGIMRHPIPNNPKHDDGLAVHNGNVAHKHLGHIVARDGLNSVGASEGSGSTSPSSLRKEGQFRANCSTGDSANSNLSSSAQSSDYVPQFSSAFQSQKDFDDMPIQVKANPMLEQAFVGSKVGQFSTRDGNGRLPENGRFGGSGKPRPVATLPPKPKSREMRPRNERNVNPILRNISSPEDNQVSYHNQRSMSPPVPALAKKLELGLHPDVSGRISSLPPELLSPVPSVPIGSVMPRSPYYNLDHIADMNYSDSRLSSAEPKVDIDIAITRASNPDLQEIMYNYENSARSHHQSLQSGREAELLKLPDIVSGRSNVSAIGSRPVTNATDLSIQAQEDFIRDLMNKPEIKEQLSARENELTEKGIIEFNVRLPATWAPPGLTSGKSRKTVTSHSKDSGLESQTSYQDPFLSHSEKRRATAQWLHTISSDPIPNKDSVLSNLSHLKQGIKMQHELVHSTTSSVIYK